MFLKRLLIVWLLSLSFGFTIGLYFDYRYKKRWQWLHFDKLEEATFGKKNYDILLIGNSRVQTGLNPYYIDSITNLSSYNLGIGAADEEEMKLLSTVYLQHHLPPKLVVWGLDPSMLDKYNILKERFAYLFYLNNDTVSAYMKKNGFPTALIKLLPFTKYSFFDEYNRTSIFLPGSKIPYFRHNFYKGFINVFPELRFDASDTTNKNPFVPDILPAKEKINDTAAFTIRATIEMLRNKGIQIIFLFPPVKKEKNLKRKTNAPLFESFYIGLATEYKIPVIRSDTSSAYLNEYFVDGYHLTEPGSKILSEEVGNIIKDLYNKFYKPK